MTDPARLPDPPLVTPAGKACRQAGLPPPFRGLHREVLQFFLDHGSPPAGEWLASQARARGLSAPEAVTALAEADLVHVAHGLVTVAYPFSGRPTPHRVEPDERPAVFAMCAIDALGILLMADCDGVILSEDAAGGALVRVERANRRWAFTPSTTVVLAASISQLGPSSSCSCPHINFHTNAGGAEAYLQTHPDVRGSIFDQPTALEAAARSFGSLLD